MQSFEQIWKQLVRAVGALSEPSSKIFNLTKQIKSLSLLLGALLFGTLLTFLLDNIINRIRVFKILFVFPTILHLYVRNQKIL